MNSIIWWIVGLGILWFLVSLALTAALAIPEIGDRNPAVAAMLGRLNEWGASLGVFIAPIVQLALVFMILIAAAERFGFTREGHQEARFATLGSATNVQAFIAIAIIGALVIGSLAGIGRVEVLKDISLVVVGFYFGTRRNQAAITEAVSAGTAAGIAAATAGPQPPPSAESARHS